ncbi:cytochrome P450 [Nocardia sp. CDC153]|uniref:cytochrome P450 n=1 Tax=Nocardia sp. CDC153 TaxID=3112167 RepID=UPI002DBB52B3|nr:cytochrome P450 [Nocardia sp. CDC153]MEC3952028.1 cytochrome P450 [Nocardia sp. CDC153]
MTAVRADVPAFPFLPTTVGEPPVEFARLRAEPMTRVVLPTGDVAWLATRYDDVLTVLTDPRLSRAATTEPDAPRLGPMRPNPRSLMAMDPPRHTDLRLLVAPMFTKPRIESMRARIESAVDELLDLLDAVDRRAELNAGLSRPLAMTVICDLLGVPVDDRADFERWTEQSLSVRPDAGAAVQHARTALRDYLTRLASTPTDDGEGLFATLSDTVPVDDAVELAATLLTAGYHTVWTAITNSIVVLFRHPGELDALRRDRSLLPAAVEELLRYAPGPVSGGTIRVATADLEIGGVRVRAGEAVIPATTSANRDRATFDAADRVRFDRHPNPHIAFGAGAHRCLGRHLARLELQAALGGLLERFPALRPAIAVDNLTWRVEAMMGSVTELPVTW